MRVKKTKLLAKLDLNQFRLNLPLNFAKLTLGNMLISLRNQEKLELNFLNARYSLVYPPYGGTKPLNFLLNWCASDRVQKRVRVGILNWI